MSIYDISKLRVNIGNRLKVCNKEDWKTHQGNWLDHLKRMDMDRIPRLAL
jgi:hypothetical protein